MSLKRIPSLKMLEVAQVTKVIFILQAAMLNFYVSLNLYACECVHVYVSLSRKQVAFLAVNSCFKASFHIRETFFTMRPHQLFTANVSTPQSTVTCNVKTSEVYNEY